MRLEVVELQREVLQGESRARRQAHWVQLCECFEQLACGFKLVGLFLCAVGLVQQFDVVWRESLSGTQVEGGFRGITECLINATDLSKNDCVIGVGFCEDFEFGKRSGIVTSGTERNDLIEALDSLFFGPSATCCECECQSCQYEDYFFGVCF